MGDNVAGPSESAGAPERAGLLGAAKDLAFAGIGASALLRDEAQALYRRSLERGRADMKQLRTWLNSLRVPQGASAPAPPKRSPRAISASEEWRAALEHLDVPTATQVKVLSQQVADLEARIDELMGARRNTE